MKKYMRLVHYSGHNGGFDRSKFNPIRNRDFVKPSGGLWTSPVGASFGWKKWCDEGSFGDTSHSFEIDFSGNIYVIDCLEDLKRMPLIKLGKLGYILYPDFEKMVKMGYDAIYLTDKGQMETRFTMPDLYGWDCECVLVMNPDCVTQVEVE